MATASTAAKGTHEEQDEHAGQPDGLTRLREAAIVDAADEMHAATLMSNTSMKSTNTPKVPRNMGSHGSYCM